MSFLNNLSRQIGQLTDRAKFEAEKFQRTMRLQGELADLKKQIDNKRMEFGDRAMELYRAGQIQSPTLGDIMRGLESLQISVTLKEEEYKRAQAEEFIEPTAPPPNTAQNVPISVEQPQSPPQPTSYAPPPQPTSYAPPPQPNFGAPPSFSTPSQAPTADGKTCPNCGFIAPQTSMFCPSCGNRLGV
jgi:hypothetical protein